MATRSLVWSRAVVALGRVVLLLASALAFQACGVSSSGPGNPTAPTAVTTAAGASVTTSTGVAPASPTPKPPTLPPPVASSTKAVLRFGQAGPLDVTFPPRNEPSLFRTALEAKYRDGLRRPGTSTYVDQEGTVVWTQEYLRYRVNMCPHADAVLRVFRQIDGGGIQPTCGSGSTATFPPRNEPFDFMVQLEAKYRDGLRRPAGASFVDVEGNIVWTQEYLRYRVSTCTHFDAQQKVFDQIDGRGVQRDCTPPPPPPPPPPSSTPPPATGSGALFRFDSNSTTCRCWIGTIALQIDNRSVGQMSCSGSGTFSVSPGRHSWRACDATNDCLSGTEDIASGQTGGVTLTCR